MLAQSITERAMLVDLTIRKWSAQKTDKRMTREVTTSNGMADGMARVGKKLLALDALDEINAIASEASAEHRRRTLPWGDSGARILASAGYLDYTQAMRGFQDRWEPAVARLIDAYPDLYAQAKMLLNGGFNAADYPQQRDLARRFAFGYQVFPLPDASDFRVELGDDETARVREQITESVQDSVRQAQSDVTERIHVAVAHMAERLRGYNGTKSGSFRDSLVENVRELVDLIPNLNITGDARLTLIADQMRAELCRFEPDELRADPAIRESTASAADAILESLAGFIA